MFTNPHRGHKALLCESIPSIANLLAKGRWSLCSAFSAGNVQLINDAPSAESLSRYVVLVDRNVVGNLVIRSHSVDAILHDLNKLIEQPGYGRPNSLGTLLSHDSAECQHCCVARTSNDKPRNEHNDQNSHHGEA